MTVKAIGLRLRFGLNFGGYFSEGIYTELLADHKSRIEEITGLNGGISTAVAGHKNTVTTIYGEVTGKAGKSDYTGAADQFNIQLLPALDNAHKSLTEFREAKETFDNDYGPIRGKIPPILNSWGEDIPQDLKDKRKAVNDANGLVVSQESVFEFIEAVSLLESQALADKVGEAELAKKSWDEAKLKLEKEFTPLNDRIAAVAGTWGEDISQELKDKRKTVVDLNKLVTDKAGAFEYPLAVDLLTKQDLPGKLTAAESAKKTWDDAKIKYEKDYGDAKDKIAAVLTTWTDNISVELKGLRTALDESEKKVTAEATTFDYPKAVELLGTELSGKLTAAENGKKTWDDAKVKYEKDYGDLKDKITAVLTTWTDNISVDLKNLRTALDGSNKKVVDEATIFEFPKAVQLMGSEKLGDKLTAAENGRIDWTAAKNTHDTTFVPLLVRLNAVVGWPAKISADLKDKQTKVRHSRNAVNNQAKIFEWIKAVELIATRDVVARLTDAENAKTPWDQAKAKYPAAKTQAAKRLKQVKGHPTAGNFATETTNFQNKYDTAVNEGDKLYDYEPALAKLVELEDVDFPQLHTDNSNEMYEYAEDAVDKLKKSPALKTHAKKAGVANDFKTELDSIDERFAKAETEFNADRFVASTQIALKVYLDARLVLEQVGKHATFLARRDDDVNLPADEDPIKPDLLELKKQLAEANKLAADRLYEPAMKLLDNLVAGCTTAKQVKTDHTAHEDELKIVEPEVNKLPADTDALVGNEAKEVRAKLAAAKEAAGKRDFATAKTLLAEAKSGCTAALKMIEDNKLDKTAKEDAVKGDDPSVSLAEVRKLYEKLKTRAGHEGLVEELKAIEEKLNVAEEALKA